MARLTFAVVQEYALNCGYEVVRTSEGYSIYPCNGSLAERMGGYKAKTLNIVIDVIKQGYGLDGEYCDLREASTTKQGIVNYTRYQQTYVLDGEIWTDRYENSCLVSSEVVRPHYIVDFFLLAFDIKLTATVIEIYCAEISKECDKRSIEHPEIKPDLVGTAAMYLGFDANSLFSAAYCGYSDDMPDWWFDCLNACINTIQPITKDNAFELLADEPQQADLPDWFCDAIEMFTESEEDFNTRIILEEIYRSTEALEPIYWDANKNTLCDAIEPNIFTAITESNSKTVIAKTSKQRTIELFCSMYGFDLDGHYSAKFIKDTILNYLPVNAFMVAVSLECQGVNLWEALEGAMWWHRDYKADNRASAR